MANQEQKRVTDHNHSGIAPSFVAGVGASAGGLEALDSLFSNMPADSSIAFVVIQHLSPDYKSLMVELLSKRTDMEVIRAENNMEVFANCVYLIPPKKIMTISDGRLQLKDKDPHGILNLPINDFLVSLAEDKANRAIAIILSGTGSDGTLGVQAIKEAGGVVLVQDPDSAKFNGMPRSAIAHGFVDYTLPPDEIPSVLMQHAANWSPTHKENVDWAISDEGKLASIFQLVKKQTGVDFSQYKTTTSLRRLQRRLQMNRLTSLSEYLDYLVCTPGEVKLFYNEMLIKVTNFFRDREPFTLLADLIPELVETKEAGDVIRVWSCGCSTGEEAYSLAMLFRETLDTMQSGVDVKIFATDLDRNSIEFASAGEYPAHIAADVPQPYLEKYFEWDGEHYRIVRSIRESVVFAPHNLAKDPPFTRIDLVCCRNLLIYLQPDIQRQILSYFGFSLRANGYLFLGSSESIGDFSDQFKTINSHWKIYQIRDYDAGSFAKRLNFYPEGPQALQLPKMQKVQRKESKSTVLTAVIKALVEGGARSCAVVNETYEIVYLFGEIEQFFSFSSGETSLNILDLVEKDLSMAISMAFGRAQKETKTIFCHGLDLRRNGQNCTVDVAVRRVLPGFASQNYFLVLIDSRDNKKIPQKQEDSFVLSEQATIRVNELEDDLRYTQENLQATIEELETANEELQATNEELLSSNEELQSTNEELQSVNEELYTVNSEYQNKIDELTEVNNDIDNLLRCTDIGSIFLDRQAIIRRFTPAATQYINLIDMDVGRSFFDLSHKLEYEDLFGDVRFAMTHHEAVSKEVKDRDGGRILLKIFPYITESREKNGIVINFVDLSMLGDLESRLANMHREKDLIFEIMPDPLFYYDAGLKLLWATENSFSLLQQPPSELIGTAAKNIQKQILGSPASTLPALRAQRTGERIHMEFTGEDGKKWMVSALPISHVPGNQRRRTTVVEQWRLYDENVATRAGDICIRPDEQVKEVRR